MDPDYNLFEQREIGKRLVDAAAGKVGSPDATRLAELVLALDEWLSNGGALPSDWDDN